MDSSNIPYSSLVDDDLKKTFPNTGRNFRLSVKKHFKCGDFVRALIYTLTCVAVIVVATIIYLYLLCGTKGSMDNHVALEAVAEGNMQFSLQLYQLLKEKEGNVFVSPLSLEVVLALAYLGAKGVTASQIAKGIHLPEDHSLIQDGFLALLNNLKSTENYTLEIANKVYTMKGYAIREEFNSVATKSFLSEAQRLDFGKNVEASGVINAWVEERTKKKIQNLITPDMLNSLTRMVLVNAVYFKGNWSNKFSTDLTTTEPFFLNAKEKKDVQMMHITKKFHHAVLKDLDAAMLELPYQGGDLSMVVLLPNKVDGIAELEAKLVGTDLTALMASMEQGKVIVSLPKFKLEETMELNEVLKKMGMTEMYEDTADFSGISDSIEQLKVSKVVQKSFIEVNEEGSEAAAATGMIMMTRMCLIPEEPKSFKADHPFMFFMRHRGSGAVLFVGRLSNV